MKLVDYSTNHSIETLQNNLKSLLIVLTPHKSQSSNIPYILEVYKKSNTGYIKITPKDFIKSQLNDHKTSHLVVEDYDLMATFGYKDHLSNIKNLGFNFIYLKNNTIKCTNILNFNKYIIKCANNDYFYYLYLMYLKYKDIVILCKNYKKMVLFCEILNIECMVDEEYKEEYSDKMCVVVEEYKEVGNKVIYIGVESEGKEMEIEEKPRVKYRIQDLVRSLSRDVVNGRRQINTARFKDILK
ncbi:uncharacterized protein VNE69_04022 [Vairimorpha necatrix]|uniref:Uncharacterized protein n=1 Tax=Vairimorpha necatrix TaxID=6039 RepID=A0AAX4JBF2_9MICR